MNLIALRQNTLRLSWTITRQMSSKSSNNDDVSWSTGEKQKPLSWRHEPDMWYRRADHLISPHPLDPKDPKQKYPHKREDGGIQHHNFVYYPRDENEKDPEIKPTPLLLVSRLKKLKHSTWWEKKILKRMKLDEHCMETPATVVKNIPEVNAALWQVKHLVRIQPLHFPEDVPEDANPLHFFIKDDGEVIYNPSVNLTDEDLEPEETEITMRTEWVNEQTRKKYHMSLDLEF